MRNSQRKGTYYWLTIAVFVLSSIMFCSLSNAQGPGFGRGYEKGPKPEGVNESGFCKNLPDLTEDQEKKITALRTKFLKESQVISNTIDIKEAELHALSTAEKPDMKAIEAKIDEIGLLKSNLAKKKETHRQDVRALLTEDQRVIFDAHSPRGGGFHGGTPQGGNGPGCRQNCPKK